MSNETPVSDDLVQWMSASDGKLELTTQEIRSAGIELLRHRAMLRRVEAVLAQLEQRTRDPASVMWAAELRAAITGRKYLCRCPEHGDREASSQRHERGVNCGKPLPPPWKRPGGSVCSQTAVLVGEIEAP